MRARGSGQHPDHGTRTSDKRLCFLSMDDMGDYVSDDELAIGPLRELGWETETVSWRSAAADWGRFRAVVIRTPWDYQDAPDEFLRVLGGIERSGARLENPLDVVEWNLSKTYLGVLREEGVRIVPTVFDDASIGAERFDGWLKKFGAEEIIIKPVVSATAQDTFRLKEFSPEAARVLHERRYLVQPFMENIIAEGEYSLFYFGGRFSHAILKTPKQGDFRVQEEWGGIITAVDEPDAGLLLAGRHALEKIGRRLLYARVDLVRDDEGEFALMELELIEPALYLRMDPEAPRRFARAFDEWMRDVEE